MIYLKAYGEESLQRSRWRKSPWPSEHVWDFEEEVALMVMEMFPEDCEHPKHFYSSIQKRKIDDLLLRSRARQHNKPRIATWRGMASCGGIIVFKNMFFFSNICINIFDFFKLDPFQSFRRFSSSLSENGNTPLFNVEIGCFFKFISGYYKSLNSGENSIAGLIAFSSEYLLFASHF